MERTEITKALECCALGDCFPCPYSKWKAGCRDEMCGDALALINELTEQNEKLLNELKGAPLMPSEYEVLYKGKCEENKELTRKLECANLEIECKDRKLESYMLQYGTVSDKEVWLKKERADTVKKYREGLYRALAHLDANDKFNKKFFLTEADRVAKEIAEGEG